MHAGFVSEQLKKRLAATVEVCHLTHLHLPHHQMTSAALISPILMPFFSSLGDERAITKVNELLNKEEEEAACGGAKLSGASEAFPA